MKKTIEQIESALTSLGAFDDDCEKALQEINEAAESLEMHPHPVGAEVRRKLGCTVEELKAAGEEGKSDGNPPSSGLKTLELYLAETVTEHPAIALAIGRLANALAVYGL